MPSTYAGMEPPMRGRLMLRLACFLVAIAAVAGCDPANPPDTPRPTDAGFIDWLIGKRITVEMGVIWDDVWEIEDGEVSDFRVIRITTNAADSTYAATVAFRATARGRGIQVSEAVIRYRKATEPGKLRLVEFVPISATRIGG